MLTIMVNDLNYCQIYL